MVHLFIYTQIGTLIEQNVLFQNMKELFWSEKEECWKSSRNLICQSHTSHFDPRTSIIEIETILAITVEFVAPG